MILTKPKYDNKIELFVKGDFNDGDYISNTEFISVEEFKLILPIIKKILAYKGNHNWENAMEYLTEEENDMFFEYIPFCEGDSVHTITDISAWFLSKDDSIRYCCEF